MKKAFFAIFVLINMSYSKLYSQDLLEILVSKSWKGTGTLMGGAANFEMEWNWTLEKKFLALKFKNERGGANNQPQVFLAQAYYKMSNSDSITGMWFDSRGIYFPLTGTINKKEMIIKWGDEKTEQGRTEYVLKGSNEISVTDYVLRNGEYVRFGTATYK